MIEIDTDVAVGITMRVVLPGFSIPLCPQDVSSFVNRFLPLPSSLRQVLLLSSDWFLRLHDIRQQG